MYAASCHITDADYTVQVLFDTLEMAPSCCSTMLSTAKREACRHVMCSTRLHILRALVQVPQLS